MRSSRRPPGLVVLTGAGVSRESGLATFRDAGGAWAQVRLEDVATPEAFRRDPARVHGFYNARRAQLDAKWCRTRRIWRWRRWTRRLRAAANSCW